MEGEASERTVQSRQIMGAQDKLERECIKIVSDIKMSIFGTVKRMRNMKT